MQSATEYSKTFDLTDDDDLQIPIELRERHFTEEHPPEVAIAHPVGQALWIWIWSPRDFIQIEFPARRWCAEKPYKRSLTGNRIDCSRWTEKNVLMTVDWRGVSTVRGIVRPHSPTWVPTVPK